MPRRKSVNFKRDIGVDSKFNSELIQKFINVSMKSGKKTIARKNMYDALELLVKKQGGNQEKGLELFYAAFERVVPTVEVRPRRVGGSVYQIPAEVRPVRARALAIRWILDAARSRSDKTMGMRLANEIVDAHEGRGAAVKKKSDVHRMAEANRAFSHYAW
jgi:small subunit ribosomal protein S7